MKNTITIYIYLLAGWMGVNTASLAEITQENSNPVASVSSVQIEPAKIEASSQEKSPVEKEQSTQVQESAKTDPSPQVEQPAKTEPPVKAEQPAKAKEPAKTDSSTQTEQPAKAEPPIKTEQPAKPQEPAKLEPPAKTEQSVKVESSPKKIEPWWDKKSQSETRCRSVWQNSDEQMVRSHCKPSKQIYVTINLPRSHEDVFPTENDADGEEDENPWFDQNFNRHWGLNWFPMQWGKPIPNSAVVGGFQPQPLAKLYVCRGFYNGGMHPGKLYRGYCHIGWGGDEIVLQHYQVLISHRQLHWIRSGYGVLPPRAVQGGYQHDGLLYICRAKYSGGWHPGKVVNGNCNIGWGGKEIPIPIYDVLTR